MGGWRKHKDTISAEREKKQQGKSSGGEICLGGRAALMVTERAGALGQQAERR